MNPLAKGLILMVCDQPYVSAALLNDLLATHYNTGKPIVTSGYAGTVGPPTLFHRSIFPELLQLQGDAGARSVLNKHRDEVEIVSFPQGRQDIDTEEDYQRLSAGNQQKS
jgi:molybdenum cofactor cytidylyltransferase